MQADDVTPFFTQKNRSSSQTNSTHTSVTSIRIDEGIRYVRIAPPSDGWVGALNSSKVRIPLCEYTKIKLLDKRDGRIFFRLLDGNSGHVGEILSMKESGAIEHFFRGKRGGGITIKIQNFSFEEYVYSIQRNNQELIQCSGELKYEDLIIPITLSTRSLDGYYKDKPLPVGTYNIMAPDYPHSGSYSRFYRQDRMTGQFDLVWFPIEFEENTRYLHMGHISDGCVTVTNINNWESLYHKIIHSRSDGNITDIPGGGKYIGKLIVSKDDNQKPSNRKPRPLSSY